MNLQKNIVRGDIAFAFGFIFSGPTVIQMNNVSKSMQQKGWLMILIGLLFLATALVLTTSFKYVLWIVVPIFGLGIILAELFLRPKSPISLSILWFGYTIVSAAIITYGVNVL